MVGANLEERSYRVKFEDFDLDVRTVMIQCAIMFFGGKSEISDVILRDACRC